MLAWRPTNIHSLISSPPAPWSIRSLSSFSATACIMPVFSNLISPLYTSDCPPPSLGTTSRYVIMPSIWNGSSLKCLVRETLIRRRSQTMLPFRSYSSSLSLSDDSESGRSSTLSSFYYRVNLCLQVILNKTLTLCNKSWNATISFAGICSRISVVFSGTSCIMVSNQSWAFSTISDIVSSEI